MPCIFHLWLEGLHPWHVLSLICLPGISIPIIKEDFIAITAVNFFFLVCHKNCVKDFYRHNLFKFLILNEMEGCPFWLSKLLYLSTLVFLLAFGTRSPMVWSVVHWKPWHLVLSKSRIALCRSHPSCQWILVAQRSRCRAWQVRR